MQNYRASLGGSKARINGRHFEDLIDLACQRYKELGIAMIEKNAEPVKQLRAPNQRGQFLACYTKKAQPDYKGTYLTGRSIVFEAKHTDSNRIEQKRVTAEQAAALWTHEQLGAWCFVLVSFRFENFYRVPFSTWEHMAVQFGKVSVTEQDLEPYRLTGGVMCLLGHTVSEAQQEADKSKSLQEKDKNG